ncbi:MarR family transcriptional regulator [Streptomyces sp. NPDC047108]|uniref:MarR family winged helix-turn-helix transcriptional regulator n=1 Tax=Streptomyces sp. NPDC047108 TaxID=3155025 RepID=UPI0033C9F248
MTEPRWLDDLEIRAWVTFLETTSLLNRRIEVDLRQEGITMVQYEILTRLLEVPERRRRMTELANLLVSSRSGLTYQVTQLEKAGLVTRETCPDDERGVVAALTDKGRALLERAAPSHVRVVREGLIDLLDRDQLTALAEIMTIARDRLRER